MKTTLKLPNAVGLLVLVLAGIVTAQLCFAPDSQAADSPAEPNDPELEAAERAAKLADAEAKLQDALKRIAEAKKAAQAAANSDLQRAEQEKARAEAEKAIAEAEKAKFNASLPTPTSKPSEGNVDLDDKAGYYADILAHETVRGNAIAIAGGVAGKLANGTTVFLVTNPDYLRGGLQLKEVEQRLTAFGNLFDALPGLPAPGDVNVAAAPLALAAIPAVLGSLADIAGMFRVDRSIKGRNTNVGQEALLSEVARALHQATEGKNIKVIRPSLNTKPAPPVLTALDTARGKADASADRLITSRIHLSTISNTVDAAQASVTELKLEITAWNTRVLNDRKLMQDEILRLKQALEKIALDKPAERKLFEDKIKAEEAALARLEDEAKTKNTEFNTTLSQRAGVVLAAKNLKARHEVRVAQTEAVLKAFTELTAKLVTVSDGAAASPLGMLAEISLLQGAGANELMLTAAVAGQGGEVETRKSVWTSGRVYHRAGTACSYTLFNNEGVVLASGLAVTNLQTLEGQPIKPHSSVKPARSPAHK